MRDALNFDDLLGEQLPTAICPHLHVHRLSFRLYSGALDRCPTPVRSALKQQATRLLDRAFLAGTGHR